MQNVRKGLVGPWQGSWHHHGSHWLFLAAACAAEECSRPVHAVLPISLEGLALGVDITIAIPLVHLARLSKDHSGDCGILPTPHIPT